MLRSLIKTLNRAGFSVSMAVLFAVVIVTVTAAAAVLAQTAKFSMPNRCWVAHSFFFLRSPLHLIFFLLKAGEEEKNEWYLRKKIT